LFCNIKRLIKERANMSLFQAEVNSDMIEMWFLCFWRIYYEILNSHIDGRKNHINAPSIGKFHVAWLLVFGLCASLQYLRTRKQCGVVYLDMKMHRISFSHGFRIGVIFFEHG